MPLENKIEKKSPGCLFTAVSSGLPRAAAKLFGAGDIATDIEGAEVTAAGEAAARLVAAAGGPLWDRADACTGVVGVAPLAFAVRLPALLGAADDAVAVAARLSEGCAPLEVLLFAPRVRAGFGADWPVAPAFTPFAAAPDSLLAADELDLVPASA